jgi:hypothetical protein
MSAIAGDGLAGDVAGLVAGEKSGQGAAAQRLAQAAPMPVAPPATMATLLARRGMAFSFNF